MNKMTDKQRQFVSNKAAGATNRDAAIAAGYAPNNADVQACNLMRRPDIKAAIKAAQASGVTVTAAKDAMPQKQYADPMTFLEDVMNNAKLPIALRVDAAKQLLPYKHARIGELGKKEKAKERANAIAGKPRFAPKSPPTILRAIDGGKGRQPE